MNAEIGDVIVRKKLSGLGNHYGIVVRGGNVVHQTPEQGKHVSTLQDFSAGMPVQVGRPNVGTREKLAIERRALSNLGRPYDIFNYNCESVANEALTGVPNSPAVEGLAILAGIALLAKCFTD